MKVSLTSVMVDDQDKALRFYTEVLGFVKKTDVPAGDDRRRGPAGNQPLDIHHPPNVVQPQLDEFGALLDEVAVLGDRMPVSPAPDADANHGSAAT